MNRNPKAADIAPDIRACFFGDSIVAGVGDSSGLGWVGRVTAAARAAGHRLTSYNLGVRGETSAQVASRIPIEAPPRLRDAEDPRIVISFGVNDAIDDGNGPCASVEDGQQSMRTAARFIRSERLFMVGPPATADDPQNALVEQRDRAFENEAARLGFPYVSIFGATVADATWQHQVSVGDGFHPDAEGYELLAAVIQPVLLAWLAHDTSTATSAGASVHA